MDPTRQSKIARLPAHVREQVNRRLFDGQPGSEILPWLNGLPEVAQILAAKFEGIAISDTNLSNWRTTGYADWLKRRDQAETIKERADYCLKVVEAGGDVLQGSAAIAGGVLMQVIEDLDPKLQSDLIEYREQHCLPDHYGPQFPPWHSDQRGGSPWDLSRRVFDQLRRPRSSATPRANARRNSHHIREMRGRLIIVAAQSDGADPGAVR